MKGKKSMRHCASARKAATGGFRSALLLFCLMVCFTQGSTAQQAPRISDLDRVRLAEAFHLADNLQEHVWPGWHKAPFAVLLVTPDYEFLMRHSHPSKEFLAAGTDRLLRSPVYYRKRQFAVNLLATFPAVNGLSTIVVGQAENTQARTSTPWIVTLLHEHFHQWQDSQPRIYKDIAALDLAHGDTTGMWMLNYPFPYAASDVNSAFAALAKSLSEALQAVHMTDFAFKVAAYRAAQQRFRHILSEADYKYFQFQLWKEGTARYTEYRIAALAAARYHPGDALRALKDYTPFAQTAAALKAAVLADLPVISLEKSKRTAFYSYGAAEALLLDAVDPHWQQRYMQEKFVLDSYFDEAPRQNALSLQKGRLSLPGLPPTAHVYADGKPAAIRKEIVELSPGWHEIQVEALLPEKGVVAYRRSVQIISNKTAEMPIVWHRVTLGSIENGHQAYFPPGAAGPAGEPGPPARPFQPLPLHPDTAELQKPLEEARDILAEDLLARTQDALNSLDKFAILEYVYAPEGNVDVVPGSSGPIGPPGTPGVPAEARLIQTAQGVPVAEELIRASGLRELEQTFSRLEGRLRQLATAPGGLLPPVKPFKILTPEWKQDLDRSRAARLAAPRSQNGIVELPDVQGPAGAPGRRGPDGVPPPDAAPVELTREQEKALLAALLRGKGAQEKMQQIRNLLSELSQRVTLAEGMHLGPVP